MDIKNPHGNAEPTESAEGEESSPKYMTAEEFNRALTPFRKQVKQQEAMIAKLEQLLNTSKEASPASEEEAPTAKSGKRDPEKEEMRKQLAKLLEKDRATEEREKDRALRSHVGDHLKQVGVNPDFLDVAVGHLVDTKKAVKLDNDGNLLMHINNFDLDLADAVKEWVKTPEGKRFLPSTGAKGSGDTSKKTSNLSKPKSLQEAQSNFLGNLLTGTIRFE